MIDPREVVGWLVDGAPGASGPQQVIVGLCTRLVRCGVRIHHMETFVRTLHPSIVGLTRTATPQAVIRALNDLFGCQIPAIEKRGGEVLKFIGDGLLAIFPYDDTKGPPRAACDAAFDAATEAFAALEARNRERTASGDPAIAFGLALHLGDISYGNIGAQSRLDFTCIGPAVNVAARLESLASKLSRTMVVSEAFAALCSRPLEDLCTFELKGVDQPQRAFAPKP